VISEFDQDEKRFFDSQPMTPTSDRGGARSAAATKVPAAFVEPVMAYLSTSFMRELNQFMKADVDNDSVR
jgi:hypothetical protein